LTGGGKMADETGDDDLGLALRALGFGVLLGATVIVITLWVVRTLQLGAAPSAIPDPGGREGTILLGGTMLGVVIGGGSTWTLLAPLQSMYRRGGLSMVAGFAAFAVSLLSMPVYAAFDRTGLLGLAGATALGALWFGRRSRAAVETR
jgi:hypothetical protein